MQKRAKKIRDRMAQQHSDDGDDDDYGDVDDDDHNDDDTGDLSGLVGSSRTATYLP